MVLTAAAIKTVLDGLTYAEPVHISDFVVPEQRRKFPSIEIDNQGSELRKQDERTQETAQRFLVHLYYRMRASSSNDVAAEKLIEDVILAGLEAATIAGPKIYIENKEWDRDFLTTPTHHTHSILTVFATDIDSTTGLGATGADWTVSLPSLSNMQLLNKPIERDIEIFDNRYDDGMARVGTDFIGETRSFFGEVEATDARMTQLRSLKNARNVVSATLSRNGVDEIVNCKVVAVSNGASYSELETVTFQLEVLP